MYNRISQVGNALNELEVHEQKTSEAIHYNSASSRPELWKESLELILEHPLLGVGTGDIKDELMKKYRQHHFDYAISRKLNPHNQFLHTTTSIGIIGLLILLFCFTLQAVTAIKKKDVLYFCFLFVIVLNALTESVLEVEKGIILFGFFSMLFYTSKAEIPAAQN